MQRIYTHVVYITHITTHKHFQCRVLHRDHIASCYRVLLCDVLILDAASMATTMRADTECCLVTFRISKTKIYAESCYRVLLCEALSIDEKEPHCELLQSAALWRSDAEREYEIPSWYENHCLMHIGVLARIKILVFLTPLYLAGAHIPGKLSSCCYLPLAECHVHCFFLLS